MSTPTIQGAVTVHNAPRDVEKLAILGPFMLKRLAESLGLLENEEARTAFLKEPINGRAQVVYENLLRMDGGKGAAPPAQAPAAAPAAPAQAPAPAPAPAQAAPNPPRTPVQAAPHTNGTTDPVQVLLSVAAMVQGLDVSVRAIGTVVEAVGAEVKSASSLKADIQNLRTEIQVITKLQHLTIGVLAQIAEQQLGAGFVEVLEQVSSEYGNIMPYVEKMLAGK